jgi:hypothetical protein
VCEHLFDAGVEVITDAAHDRKLVVLWCNRADKRVRFDLRNAHGQWHNGGAVPRFKRLVYSGVKWGSNEAYIANWGPWSLAFDYDGYYTLPATGRCHCSRRAARQ